MEGEKPKHRLFLGIPVPVEAAAALAESARRELTLPGVRPVPAENLHVTLIFFGEVDAAGRDELIRLTREVRWEALRRLREPMFWIESSPLFAMLRYLPAAELEKVRRRERKGEGPELHVTVARAKTPPRELPRRLGEMAFELDRLALFQSFLGPEGSRYVELAFSGGEGSL